MVGLHTVSQSRGTNMPPEVSSSDILVLREQITAQSRAISDLVKNSERLLELTTSIARMQERMEQHADGLDRAFNLIEKLDTRSEEGDKQLRREIDGVAEDLESAVKTGEADRHELRSEINHWVNFGKGAWVAGSILWVLIAWLLVKQIDSIETGISTALNTTATLERRLTDLEHKQALPNKGGEGGK